MSWAKIEDLGAGEIFLTCVHKEGLKSGFDIKIIKKICNSVKLPVIAHGGAGSFSDIFSLIKRTKLSVVAVSSLFHYETCLNFPPPKVFTGNIEFLKRYQYENKNFNIKIIKKLKNYLRKNNIEIR